MKKNMALLERILRFIVAVVLLVLFFTTSFSSPWNYIVPIVGVVFLLTSLVGNCPLYSLLGIDTRQFKEKEAK